MRRTASALLLGGVCGWLISCYKSPFAHCSDPGGCKPPLVCAKGYDYCVMPPDAGRACTPACGPSEGCELAPDGGSHCEGVTLSFASPGADAEFYIGETITVTVDARLADGGLSLGLSIPLKTGFGTDIDLEASIPTELPVPSTTQVGQHTLTAGWDGGALATRVIYVRACRENCPVEPTSDGGINPGADGADGGAVGPVGPSLQVATGSLATAVMNKAYSQSLAATGGTPPYLWALSAKPAELAWLSVSPYSGVLSGVPDAAALQGLVLTVTVTDQTASTVAKVFVLTVAECSEGDSVACMTVDANACILGSRRCALGQMERVCSGTGSTDINTCGPACGPCGSVANACSAGKCACGAGPACAAGETCCGGQCKRLDNVRSCGTCSNDCVAQAGAYVSASCSLGQCAFACAVEAGHTHQHCVGSVSTQPTAGVPCETDVAQDVTNCGSCQHDCTPTTDQAKATVTSVSCASGACGLTCRGGVLNCDGATANGCEKAFDTQNCGHCGSVCTPGPHQTSPSCDANGTCQFACVTDWADCNAGGADGCETNLNTSSSCGTCASHPACQSGYTCHNRLCVCALETAPCPSGTHCGATSGRCECDSTSCGGCCTQQGVGGVCVAGTENSSCGVGGATCSVCGGDSCCTGCKLVNRVEVCTVGGAQVCMNHACACEDTAKGCK